MLDRRAFHLTSTLVVAACMVGAAGACAPHEEARDARASDVPHRVVTLAPSMTEIVFALGRGDRVVGVDSFTVHPPETARLERVGGLVDPNFERLLSLRPDLVVVVSEHQSIAERLRAAHVEVLALRSESLSDLFHGVEVLGQRLDAKASATALSRRLRRELDEVARATRDESRAKLLYVFDRQPGAIRDVFAAGGRSFLDELIEIAGGRNVLHGVNRGAVSVSTEAILASQPDVIFDATRDPAGLAPWRQMPELPAVASGRLVETSDPIFTIPGPRVPEAARRMARALHPGVSLGANGQ